MSGKSLSLYPVRSIPLDANGFPIRHREAKDAAVTLFQEMVNELPESVYHLNYTDAEWIAGQMLLRYLGELERV